MGTPAAPRIDERLRRFIAGSSRLASPAEVTREVGSLAWQLGLPRPSYEQVRVLFNEYVPVATATARPPRVRPPTRAIDARAIATTLGNAIFVLYEYPGPGLAGWYSRYVRGG